MTERQQVILTGIVGIAAAAMVGTGEFLLHFDPLARYGQGFEFFNGVSESQATLGHFIGVLGAPLYVVGAWHLCLMLRSANQFWAKVLFFAMSYGCIVGAVWIGSRATAAMLVNSNSGVDLAPALSLYELRYDTLLTATRIAILAVSVILVWLSLTGRSRYPKWMAVLNPILLILASFFIFWLAPSVGKYLMPIALNVAFFVIFTVSTLIAVRKFNGASQ